MTPRWSISTSRLTVGVPSAPAATSTLTTAARERSYGVRVVTYRRNGCRTRSAGAPSAGWRRTTVHFRGDGVGDRGSPWLSNGAGLRDGVEVKMNSPARPRFRCSASTRSSRDQIGLAGHRCPVAAAVSLPCAPAGSVAALRATCAFSLPSADAIAFTSTFPSTPGRWPRRSRIVHVAWLPLGAAQPFTSNPVRTPDRPTPAGLRVDVDRASCWDGPSIARRGSEWHGWPAAAATRRGASIVDCAWASTCPEVPILPCRRRALRWGRDQSAGADRVVAGQCVRRSPSPAPRSSSRDRGGRWQEQVGVDVGRSGLRRRGPVARLATSRQRGHDGPGVARPGPSDLDVEHDVRQQPRHKVHVVERRPTGSCWLRPPPRSTRSPHCPQSLLGLVYPCRQVCREISWPTGPGRPP